MLGQGTRQLGRPFQAPAFERWGGDSRYKVSVEVREESGRESDEAIVLLTPETTELREREGLLLWVFQRREGRAHCPGD